MIWPVRTGVATWAAEKANTEIPRIILPCLDHRLGTLALWGVERKES
jgi:hypothetical protein